MFSLPARANIPWSSITPPVRLSAPTRSWFVASVPKIVKQPANQVGAIGTNIVFEAAAESGGAIRLPMAAQRREHRRRQRRLPGHQQYPALPTPAVTRSSSPIWRGCHQPGGNPYSYLAPYHYHTPQKTRRASLESRSPFPLPPTAPDRSHTDGESGGRGHSRRGENTFTIKEIQKTNAGMYSVMVSNVAGVAVSAPAILKVLVPPAITQQPLSVTGALGKDTTFSVKATGTPTLQYSWHFNGAPAVLETNENFSLQSVRLDQAGKYAVVITNVAGSVTSSPAMLRHSRSPSLWERFKGLF